MNFLRRVNNNIRIHIKRLADSRHRLAIDKDISFVVVNSSDDTTVCN
jgi:hypothetical protein